MALLPALSTSAFSVSRRSRTRRRSRRASREVEWSCIKKLTIKIGPILLSLWFTVIPSSLAQTHCALPGSRLRNTNECCGGWRRAQPPQTHPWGRRPPRLPWLQSQELTSDLSAGIKRLIVIPLYYGKIYDAYICVVQIRGVSLQDNLRQVEPANQLFADSASDNPKLGPWEELEEPEIEKNLIQNLLRLVFLSVSFYLFAHSSP